MKKSTQMSALLLENQILEFCCNSAKRARELQLKFHTSSNVIAKQTRDLMERGLLSKLQTNKSTKKPRYIYSTTEIGKQVLMAFQQYYSLRFSKPRTVGDVDGLKLLFAKFPTDDTDRKIYRSALFEWLEELKSTTLAKIGLVETA